MVSENPIVTIKLEERDVRRLKRLDSQEKVLRQQFDGIQLTRRTILEDYFENREGQVSVDLEKGEVYFRPVTQAQVAQGGVQQ